MIDSTAIPTYTPARNAGHRVNELPIRPTKTYELIAAGKLRAVKVGRSTVILNWPEYLASLPALPVKTAA